VDFAELIFSSLIQIAALNLKSRHYVTLAMPRVVPVRRAKVFMYTQRKVVGLTLPAKASQLAHLNCLAPKSGS